MDSQTMPMTGEQSIAQPKTGKKMIWWVVAIVLAAVIIFFLYWFNLLPFNFGYNQKYQAVFLANGQVYFGRLEGFEGDYAKLTHIYYLQVAQTVQQTAPAATAKDSKGNPITPATPTSQSDIRLVKLGSELHGPEDVMYIAKNQILFYEDLKESSRVVAAISQFEGKK